VGYYQGDFYRGYRGDPGIGSFLGGLVKSAVGFIPGVGPILSKGIDTIGAKFGGKAIAQVPSLGRTGMASVGSAIVKRGIGVIKKHPVLTGAGAAGALGIGAGALGEHMLGRHGSDRKRRRMNACNPRALRRAIRRAHAFEKLAKHVIGFSSPRKPKGHMYFKKRRRK
jgi:hypothetical protein